MTGIVQRYVLDHSQTFDFAHCTVLAVSSETNINGLFRKADCLIPSRLLCKCFSDVDGRQIKSIFHIWQLLFVGKSVLCKDSVFKCWAFAFKTSAIRPVILDASFCARRGWWKTTRLTNAWSCYTAWVFASPPPSSGLTINSQQDWDLENFLATGPKHECFVHLFI